MEKQIFLRMYGQISHSQEKEEERMAWDLYQSLAMSRLRDVSLSSTPNRFAAHGMAASRFEHSVGVGYLSRKLCEKRPSLKPYSKLLLASALLHDVGSPPFSHISEMFLWDLTGRTHEEQTERLICKGSELYQILDKYQVEGEEVSRIIRGKNKTLSPLIAGSIDLDNVDNSIHLLVSLGYHEEMPYHPLRLLKAFRFRNNETLLDTEYLSEILGWVEARRTLYAILNDESHMSSSSMLYRALEFAYTKGKLGEDFFDLGESDALHHLRYQGGPESGMLVDKALRWKQYETAYRKETREENEKLSGIYDKWEIKKEFNDEIASRLKLKSEEVTVYVGQDKGEKSIDLPFYGNDKDVVSLLFKKKKGLQRLSVFIDTKYRSMYHTKKVEKAVEDSIRNLPKLEKADHIFF